MDFFDKIKEFHVKFGIPHNEQPGFLGLEMQQFRIIALAEEFEEYVDAVREKDLEGALDALVDLVYFALGTAYIHGFDRFDEAFDRVHEANMKKVRAERPSDSKRGTGFDVIKPEGWTAPRLTDLIERRDDTENNNTGRT